MARHATNLLGKTCGRLHVIARAENSAAGAARWDVLCRCGTKKTVRSSQLTSGKTKSCGCLAVEKTIERQTTHGMTKTFEFRAWVAMKKRCENPKHPAYKRYGGSGISVCTRWEKFENFIEDMGRCTFLDGSIERKDNSKGYDPSNCYWVPKAQQSKNRRNVKLYEGMTLPEMAEKYAIKYTTLKHRVAAGWPKEHWFSLPKERTHAKKD